MGEVSDSGARGCGFESRLSQLSDVYGGRGEFAGLNPRPKWTGLGGGGSTTAGHHLQQSSLGTGCLCSPLLLCMNSPHTKSLPTSFVQLPCEPIAFY